jgi:hypothetical protein
VLGFARCYGLRRSQVGVGQKWAAHGKEEAGGERELAHGQHREYNPL